MNRVIVLKFGGTSLADRDGIRSAASIVAAKKHAGHRVLVVVSARAGMTDGFLEDAAHFSGNPARREVDMLLTSGERINAALLSIALNAAGIDAISLTGSQAGIITDDNHTNARIIEIRPHRIAESLEEGRVVVVGGFQGVSFKKEVTTLGRGGSDITAVALTSALDAEVCEIYSDVDGVYGADPNLVNSPKKLDELSYQEMQEMSESGATVLHPKSVEFAKIKNTLIHAKSTLTPEANGTIIKNLEGKIKPRVIGVASEERVALFHVGQKRGGGSENHQHVLELCRQREVQTKQISFHRDEKGVLVGSFILPEKDNLQFKSFLSEMAECFSDCAKIYGDLSAVSMIGAGINDRYTTLLEVLALLQSHQVRVASYHTSSFRISLLVDRSSHRRVVPLLYDHFIRGN